MDYEHQDIIPILGPMQHQLEDYQRAALKKSVYHRAAILDPRQKLDMFTSTTLETINLNLEHMKDLFILNASKFEEKAKADSDLKVVSLPASFDQAEGPK